MSLKKHKFEVEYSKDENDLYLEFYKPCIENSVKYDRITGYFGSSIFVVILEGLKTFIKNNGKIRIICSPVISDDDYKAILKGYDEKTNERLNEVLIKEIETMKFENPKPLELLSSLIRNNVLEIKLALFKGKNVSSYSQLMHDKIGIFTDENKNQVAFGGSMNETFSGISNHGNLESFSVFTNWEDNNDKERVSNYTKRFNDIWDGYSNSVITFNFPSEATSVIKSYSKNSNFEQLYEEVILDLDKVEEQGIILDRWYAEKGASRRRARPHQTAVLNNWDKNNRQGIFEMATGSGKTFTALCAIRDSLTKSEIPLVIVPSNILLDQWRNEIETIFNDEDIKVLVCGGGNNNWKRNNMLNRFTNPNLSTKRIVISTLQTASSIDFINQIYMSEKLFMIVDEVHRSGSDQFSKIFNIKTGPRIGLSATPRRFRDEIGTKKIYDYFKNEIEPKYDIFKAIDDGNLTPYNYNFITVHLTPDEQEDWNIITKQINRKVASQFSKTNSTTLEMDNHLEMMLIKRARIIKKAKNKINAAFEIIDKYYEEGQSWLIYCEDEVQLREVFEILGLKGYRRYYYISNMDSDKPETLKSFELNAGILVSIKCLDEGVDIPAVSHALILSSSTNPREYIQRRGRVLRKSPNKNISHIFDCITLPHSDAFENDNISGMSIIKSEIARALQFAEHADNKITTSYQLREITINYDIDLEEDSIGGFEYE